MGRSVATPADRNSVVVYASVGDDEDYTGSDWRDDLCRLRDGAKLRWPSMERTNRYAGNELRVIAESRIASLVIAEYYGCVSLSLVPNPQQGALAVNWVSKAETKLRDLAQQVFGESLHKVGTFSNGESVFQRDAAVSASQPAR